MSHDAWRTAAHIAGEVLGGTAPDGYYSMTPNEWLEWFRDAYMEQLRAAIETQKKA